MRRRVLRSGGLSASRPLPILCALVVLAPALLPALGALAAAEPLALSGVYLSIPSAGLELPSSYVVAGDSVWVNTTVANAGDVQGNATLEILAGDPPSGAALASTPITVPPDSNLSVPLLVDTTGLLGIQRITARLASILPPENGSLADNSLSATLRVHTRVDLLWQNGDQAEVANATYYLTGFLTVRDNASFAIGPSGRLLVSQGRPDEFDVLVEGNGLLRLDGGVLESNFSIGVELRDNGTLIVENGGVLRASVRADTTGGIRLAGGQVVAPLFEVRGAAVSLDGADLSVGALSFEASQVTVSRSTITSTSSVSLRSGAVGDFRNASVEVRSSYSSVGEAEASFPGIGAFLGSPSAPYQPAVSLSGTASASFRRTAATSSILIGGLTLPSSRPIFAFEAATATVYRVARVAVTDPIGVPVPNATVQVFDYWGAPAAAGLALNGTADVELPSAYLEASNALDTVNYRVVASRGVATSAPLQFAFALFPDLSEGALVKLVPVALALFEPVDLYEGPVIYVNQSTTSSTDLVTSSNLEVRSPLTYSGGSITLLQTRPFERYILVADNGSLSMVGGTIRSDYPFDLYVLNGSDLSFEGGGLVGGNLLLKGAGNLTAQDARIVGSAIGDARAVSCDSSFLWGRIVQLSLGTLAARDCVVAASEKVTMGAADVSLESTGVSTTFEPFDATNRTSLSFADFEALAGSDFATASSSASLSLDAGSFNASGLTVWTPSSFALSAGASNASLEGARLLAGSTSISTSAGRLAVSDVVVDPAASFSLAGSGYMSLRSVSAPPPSVASTLTVDFFSTVEASVVDELGLPVDSAQVVAVPQVTGRAIESVTTGADGLARLTLLASTTAGGTNSRGPLYRVNATKGAAASTTFTWDPLRAEPLAFSLAANFATATADASYALVVPLPAGLWRVQATNLPQDILPGFLQTFVAEPPALDFATEVYAGQGAKAFVAADYIFTAGGQSVTQPMSGVGVTLDFDGAAAASLTLGGEGMGTGDLFLPAAPGAHGLNVTFAAPLLAAPLTLSNSFSLRPLTQLLVSASISKASYKPSEAMIVQGRVTDDVGVPVAGASVRIEIAPDKPVRTERTSSDGSFFARIIGPAQNGSYQVRVNASAPNALDSAAAFFPYVVLAEGVAPPPLPGGGANVVPALLSGSLAVLCGVGLVYFYTQRRIATGQFVVCGKCDKPTLASSKKCNNCGVEFETSVAKCSKCGSWIAPDSAACPQCRTVFVHARERAPREDGGIAVPEPSRGVAADFDIPEAVPLTGRKGGAARLEDLEFKLPGTTDTMDLGEKGTAPTFTQYSPAPVTRPAQGAPPSSRPLERMELPRVDEDASAVREVSPLEGGEPTAKEPVSLGTGNIDLSRTTAAATSTKTEAAPDEEIPEAVLRELLMKAAPELSGEMLPGDIKKELQEIARSEAPVSSEKRGATAAPRSERPAPLPPEERTAEAPEKSKKSAFDVFSTPTKSIPSGYEKKGAPPKEAAGKAAPVCPNCGGNWVVQRDGKNSCRVCGTRW